MFEPELYPLTKLLDGTVRIADTRITLDTLVHSFKAGATPEAMVLSYPTVKLSDVYAVITYYLKHREEVETYLSERAKQAAEIQQDIEKRFDPSGIRERLLARRNEQR
jgi:uncharacterized protein (DUF433 family)